MSGWNWRLYKETIKDDHGRPVEKLSFKEIWYDDNGKPNGMGEVELSLDQFGELDVSGENVDITTAPYEPLDEDTAKESMRWLLGKLTEALDKPILTADTFNAEA